MLAQAQAKTAKIKSLTGGKPDYWLAALVAVILILGTVMIYSASFVSAAVNGNPASVLFRHLLWLIVGSIGLVVAMQVDYHSWRNLSIIAMIGVLVCLSLVLVLPVQFAPDRFGAKRWIAFGEDSPIGFQPSEFAKLVLILYGAHWLSTKGDKVRNFFYGLVPFALTLGAIIALVMLEPDLGTSLVIGAIGLGMFFVAGANLFHMLVGIGLSGGAGWLLVTLVTYRADRLKHFSDPLSDITGHTAQAILGLGSGGVFGVGLGASRSKFFWLPTVYTDSIFVVLGEELGLVGTFLVVFLFLALAWRGFSIARHAPDGFGRLIAVGVTVYIIFQAFLNIAVVSNLVPFTGIPLPFISYGGSSLAISMIAIGLLLNVSKQQVDDPRILEMEAQREMDRRQRDLLREQRAAERERREALRSMHENRKAEQDERELEAAKQSWEARTTQERAELAWREKLDRELKRQKAEEQERKRREQAQAEIQKYQPVAQEQEDLPAVATKSYLELKNGSTGSIKLRKPRRDWAKVYNNIARRNDDK